MTNTEIKKAIEKATGKKVQYWSRKDNGEYEACASCLPACDEVYSFAYAESKSTANYRILLKLAKFHNVEIED